MLCSLPQVVASPSARGRHRRSPADAPLHFRTLRGFTVAELIVTVALILILTALVLPGLQRARKRAQATKVKTELRLIDEAVALYALETHRKTGATVYVDDWTEYVKGDSNLYFTGQDLFGREYGDQSVDRLPSVPAGTFDAFSSAVDAEFWRPYGRETAPPTVTRTRKKKR